MTGQNDGYYARIGDAELSRRLESAGAVLIEGPRACGKTETARQVAASEVLLDVDDNARRAIEVDPALVLAGDTPRLIDEWQLEPALSRNCAGAAGPATCTVPTPPVRPPASTTWRRYAAPTSPGRTAFSATRKTSAG